MRPYINDNNLSVPLQSAYKAKHSTETALLKIFNDILLQIDNQQVVLLTLLDLSAAFDTVDHHILLHRLEHSFGFKGEALQWFKSYLTNRTQRVCINGEKSQVTNLDCCVPQGSILGAPLYSDYTSPTGKLLRLLIILFHMYADDTQLMKFLNPNNIDEQVSSVESLESGIGELADWMKNNKLKLNEEKTEFLIIGTKQQLKKMQIDSITLEMM